MAWIDDVLDLALSNWYSVVTLGSGLVAFISAWFARRETIRQTELQAQGLRRQMDHDTLIWGREAIHALADAGDLCDRMNSATFADDQLEIARRISSLVDRGRMYFPNVDAKGRGLFVKKIHGAHKDPAFRGSRPPILDAMMFAYYEVRALGNTEVCQGAQDFIWDCRRLLVSELQGHIDPQAMKELIRQYNQQSAEEQKLAQKRASVLRARLQDRRPGVIDESDVAPAMDQTP